MRMRLYISGVLLIFLTMTGNVSAQENFIAGTQDIPLMDKLSIDISDDMNFDTPAGQLMVFEAKNTHYTGSDVLSYYRNTLPKMGWTKTGNNSYIREKDSITISIIREQKPSVVRFEIVSTNTN